MRNTPPSVNQLGLFEWKPPALPSSDMVPSSPALVAAQLEAAGIPMPSPGLRFTPATVTPRKMTPRRRRGSPGPPDVEAAARDAALAVLAERRAGLVAEARAIAIQIAKDRGRVTSVEVFATMRAFGYDEQLDAVDPRWIGCIWREELLWERVGFEGTGSHKRPVSIWRLALPLTPRPA